MPIGVSRVFHLNVNCSDLGRSLGFYRDLLGLSQGAHTVPAAPQPGAAFGLDEAQWDAHILTDTRGYEGVAVDLLEWQVPRPVGKPYPVANYVGFTRLGFARTDLEATHSRLLDAGADCLGPPHDVDIDGVAAVRAFVCTDPDGTLVELVSGDVDRLAFATLGCRGLERSVEFYAEVLGFHPRARFPSLVQDGAGVRLGPETEVEMAFLDDPRGTGTFALDLIQWKRPVTEGAAYPSANHLGIYRLALLTDDIDAAYEELLRKRVPCRSGPATLDMGPGLPELRALLFSDPDGATLELIEAPRA